MAKDKSELLVDLPTTYPDQTNHEITPGHIRGQQTDIINSLALESDMIEVFTSAAYGGIGYSGPPIAHADIDASWQTVEIANQLSIAIPRKITPSLGDYSLAPADAGVFMVTVNGSFSHNSDNSGRVTSLRAYDLDTGTPLGGGYQIGAGRNTEATNFSVSVPFEVSAPSAGDRLVVQIGGGDTFTSVEFTAFSYLMHGIGEFRGVLPSME